MRAPPAGFGPHKSRLSERMRHALRVEVLLPEHDAELPRFGIGLTDVVGDRRQTLQNLQIMTSQNGYQS